MSILIKGGRVLNPATQLDEIIDVLVEEDKITEVSHNIEVQTDYVINATGLLVMPGLIDLHVHFRDPGLTYKEDIITGSKAAARGGVTTVCAMPNTAPVVDDVSTMEYINNKAKDMPVNVLQLSSITKGMEGTELVDMKAMKEAGAIAFSEDGKSVMDINLDQESMKQAADMNALIMAHCEDKDLVGKGVLNKGIASEKYNVSGISNSVEDVITARDIFLAKETGARLHLCHCSTKGVVELIKLGKNLGVNLTGEACPHHFILSDADIDSRDSNYKMNPPLRSEEDVRAIIEGLRDGTIDVISTDHAPHSMEEKSKDFTEAPFGIVGLETSAQLTYTALVSTGILSPLDMAAKMSYNPAKVLSRDDRYGRIEKGMIADIVIYNPEIMDTIDSSKFESKGKNTPFNNKAVVGKVEYTIHNGNIVYKA